MNKPQKKYKKVALAYSGGLDTSIIIPWLKENYDCEVVAVCGNVGQGKELDGLYEKAVRTGASEAYIEDLTEEFITDYILSNHAGERRIRRPLPAGHLLCAPHNSHASGGDSKKTRL
jgi:argininosuccinate synthase